MHILAHNRFKSVKLIENMVFFGKMEIIYDHLKDRLPLHLFRLKIQNFVNFNNIDPAIFNTS